LKPLWPAPAAAISAKTPNPARTKNRFELEQDAFYRRVWEKYQEIAAREPARVVLIQGDLSIDEVHEQIVEAVSERLLTASPMA